MIAVANLVLLTCYARWCGRQGTNALLARFERRQSSRVSTGR